MAALVATLLLSAAGGAQTSGHAKATTHKKTRRTTRSTRAARKPVESATTKELRELHEQLSGQQAQIDSLRTQLATRDQQVAAAQQSAAEAQSQVAAAAQATAQAAAQQTQTAQDVQQLRTSVTDLKSDNQTLTENVVNSQARMEQEISSPTTLHYKGITIQPVAFFAFEGVWRQRSVNSDINTPFNTIPFPSANEGHMSELNFSGRQSRIGALFTGDAGKLKLSGYIEADFLSAGVTSNNNQSDSYTLRQRQFWGQVATPGGFKMTGGQMWSLVTEDAKGTENRTEILPNTVDPQYMVGFNWTRQPAIRFQQSSTRGKNAFTLALALEQAQITNFTATSATTGAVPTNIYFGGTGVNGGLYNAFNGTYANNVAPDLIVKGAWDFPRGHFEFGGLARFMRSRYYPITGATSSATGVTYTYAPTSITDMAAAGGGFGSLRVMPTKYLEVGVQGMAGSGVGRYGSTQLADATLKPTGELSPIKNYHGLFSLVTHEGKNLDIYAYYGGEYAQRTVYTTTTGATIGYGARNLNNAGCYALPPLSSIGGSTTGGSDAATTCASPTRYMQEGMIGFTYRLFNSPTYGRLQYQATYSLLQRNLWSGSVATPVATAPVPTPTGPRAQDSMIHVGMRYYIP